MKVKVVCGFPGSGKSTFVANNMGSNDLKFDYDEVACALVGGEMWQTIDGKTHELITDIMDCMINFVKENPNVYEVFWIIRSLPDEHFKKKLIETETEYYYINASMQECIERITSNSIRMESKKNWVDIIMRMQMLGEKQAFRDCIFIN